MELLRYKRQRRLFKDIVHPQMYTLSKFNSLFSLCFKAFLISTISNIFGSHVSQHFHHFWILTVLVPIMKKRHSASFFVFHGRKKKIILVRTEVLGELTLEQTHSHKSSVCIWIITFPLNTQAYRQKAIYIKNPLSRGNEKHFTDLLSFKQDTSYNHAKSSRKGQLIFSKALIIEQYIEVQWDGSPRIRQEFQHFSFRLL